MKLTHLISTYAVSALVLSPSPTSSTTTVENDHHARHLRTSTALMSLPLPSNGLTTTSTNAISAALEKKGPPRTIRTEFETATILHGVNHTLTGDQADAFALCYMNSFNKANENYGAAIDTMSEDTQWVVEFGGPPPPRRQLTSATSKTVGKPPAPSKKPNAPSTSLKQFMVFYLGKFQYNQECSLCANDDRFFVQTSSSSSSSASPQEDGTNSDEQEQQKQKQRQLIHADFESRFYNCLKRSGLPNYERVAKVEVHHLTSTTEVIDPPVLASSTSTSVMDNAATASTKTTSTTTATPILERNKKNKKNEKINLEFYTATLLHGLDEILVSDDADTFDECYLTSYNEAALHHGEDPIESMTADQAKQQWLIESGGSGDDDDDGTDDDGNKRNYNFLRTLTGGASSLRTVPSHRNPPNYVPPPRYPKKNFVFTLGKFQFGPGCSLCAGDDRLMREVAVDESRLSNNHIPQRAKKELVHAAFEAKFYNCLKDSGKPSFDRLLKLEVHNLSRQMTTTPVVALSTAATMVV